MASDDFTDSNGTGLESHNAEWTSVDATNTVTNLEIQSNRVQNESGYQQSGAYYNSSSEDSSQVTLVTGSDEAADSRHTAVRMDTNELGYSARFTGGDGSEWDQIAFYKSGGYLGQTTGLGPWSYSSDHTFKITASGTSTVNLEVFVDGSSEATDSDSSSPLGTGHPGFWITTGADSVTDTPMDDWTDGAAGGGISIPLAVHHLKQQGIL